MTHDAAMRRLKNMAVIMLLILLIMYTYQRSEKSCTRDYTSAELIGKWKQVYSSQTFSDEDPEIDFIQLVNDSIAELQIIDSGGKRKVKGTWRNKFEKRMKLIDLKIESDVSILYSIDDHHYNWLLLMLSEKDEKLRMTTGKYKFQKE